TRRGGPGAVPAGEGHAPGARAPAARTPPPPPRGTCRPPARGGGLNSGGRAPAPLAGRPPIQCCTSSAGADTSAAAGLGGGKVETAMTGPVADGRSNAPIIDHFRAADAYWRASHEHAGPVSDAGVPGTAAPAGLAAVER